MSKLIMVSIAILFLLSCGEVTENSSRPNSQNILTTNDINCLYGSADCIMPSEMNLTVGALINFDQFWENYPGKDYTGDEVRAEIGGDLDAASSWLGPNTCAIRLSRGLNYSDNEIDRDNFRAFAGKTVNGSHTPGLVLSGADNKWYAIRVAEISKYFLHNYGTPITLTKNIRVTKENVEDEENRLETIELERRLKEIGAKGVIAFTVYLWDDATGHLEPWNGYHVAGHQRFKEAQSVSMWVMEDLERCGGNICGETEECVDDVCVDPSVDEDLGNGNKKGGCSISSSSDNSLFIIITIFLAIVFIKRKREQFNN